MASKATLDLTSESLGNEFVTIAVGKARVNIEPKDFLLHKKLLCSRSEYFNKAFNGKFREGAEGKLTMPDDKPEVFTIFVEYLYRGCINPNPLTEEDTESNKTKAVNLTGGSALRPGGPGEADSTPDYRDKYYHKMLEAYILAEKLCMNDFANAIMDNLRENVGFWNIEKRMSSAWLVYEYTREGSPLRKFVACDAAWRFVRATTPERVQRILETAKDVDGMAADMLWAQQTFRELLNPGRLSGTSPFTRQKGLVSDCVFHTRSEGEKCCDRKRVKREIAGLR